MDEHTTSPVERREADPAGEREDGTSIVGREIRQRRSQITYDALIAATFALLEEREFDDISIADLARHAGYSVGAFYARFRSKDELFDALLAQHLQVRKETRERIFSTAPDETLIEELVGEVIGYYWKRRRFWRAALIRSTRIDDSWEPIRRHGHGFANLLVDKVAARAGRELTGSEETNVRFAVQLMLGAINNAIINRPGPVFLEQALFVENLSRALRLCSGYDSLAKPAVAAAAKASKAAKTPDAAAPPRPRR